MLQGASDPAPISAIPLFTHHDPTGPAQLDAACLDGAGELTIVKRMVLPRILPNAVYDYNSQR